MSKDLQTKSLNVIERGELRKAETAIDKGQQTFLEVGNALAAIRDGKLYRETHKTFDAYCGERWKFTRQRAQQLIEAAVVVEELSTMVDKITTERQARELARVPEDQRESVLDLAEEKADGKPVTAAAIRQAAAEVLEAEPEIEEPQTVEDRMYEANKTLGALAGELMAIVKRAEEIDNPHFTDAKHGRLESFKAHVRSAAGTLKSAKGAGVCTYCDGKWCKHCLQTGYLTKSALESAPEKAK